jgi:hypothetical protein
MPQSEPQYWPMCQQRRAISSPNKSDHLCQSLDFATIQQLLILVQAWERLVWRYDANQ